MQDWDLIGRDAEIAVAVEAIDTGNSVYLVGAAGVGKTRLTRELGDGPFRERDRLRVLATASARTIPYGAFAPVLAASTASTTVAAEIIEKVESGHAIVTVDDAHLLDDQSAALILTLALRGNPIIATARSGEPVPDAIDALWKDDFAIRIDLQALSAAETARLLELALLGPVAPSTAQRFYRTTRGNPLYLRHLLAAARAADAIELRNGVYGWSGAAALDQSLGDLIAGELRGLPDDISGLLETLAVAEPLELRLLEQIAAPTVIARAEARAVIHTDRDGRRLHMRFSHPLYGEHVRAGMSQARAREIRRQLIEFVEAQPRRRLHDDIRLALWKLDTDGCSDLELLRRAMFGARVGLDMKLGERFARAAYEAGGGSVALGWLATSLRYQGRFDEALEQYRRVAASAVDEHQWCLAALNITPSMQYLAMGQEVDAIASLTAAISTPRGPRSAIFAMSIRCLLLACGAEFTEARIDGAAVLAALDEQVGTADTTDPTTPAWQITLNDARLYARSGLALCDIALGTSAAAVDLIDHATEFTQGLSGLIVAMVGEQAVILAQRMFGNAHAARDRATLMTDVAQTLTVGVATGTAAMLRALTEMAVGRPRQALHWTREARLGLSGVDLGNHSYLVDCTEAIAAAMLGRPDDAHASAAEAAARFRRNVRGFEPDLIKAQAWAMWAQGDGHGAGELLMAQAFTWRDTAPGWAVDIGYEALRFGAARAPGFVALHAPAASGPIAALWARHAAGLLAKDGDALESVADDFEHLGFEIYAVDTMAHAVAVHEGAGLRGRAATAAARMTELQTRCEHAATPAAADAAFSLPLTKREREIATLAAQGLTNREIADRLTVALRTVEGHLDRTFNKLGVHRRDELAAIMLADNH